MGLKKEEERMEAERYCRQYFDSGSWDSMPKFEQKIYLDFFCDARIHYPSPKRHGAGKCVPIGGGYCQLCKKQITEVGLICLNCFNKDGHDNCIPISALELLMNTWEAYQKELCNINYEDLRIEFEKLRQQIKSRASEVKK